MNLKQFSLDAQRLGVFFYAFLLPFNDQYSTVAMLVILSPFLFLVFKGEIRFERDSVKYLIIPLIFFIPRILGLINGEIGPAFNEFIRSMPVLLMPLGLMFSQQVNVKKIEKTIYLGLLFGILLFSIICNTSLIAEMIKNNEPIEYFFRWRHLNTNFIEPIGTHPPYMGLLVVWVIIKSVYNQFLNRSLRFIIVILFSFLLFQLLARNAMIVTVFFAFFIGLSKFTIKKFVVISGVLLFIGAIILYHPHDYLREKIFYKLNFFDVDKADKRVDRLEASINIIKRHPIIGVGSGFDDKLRKSQYYEMGDETAYKLNYNSHNQFFEFLVSSGILGFISFIAVLLILTSLALKSRNYSELILIIAFVISCLSESVLERSLGVKYFSLIVLLVILNSLSKNSLEKVNNKNSHD